MPDIIILSLIAIILVLVFYLIFTRNQKDKVPWTRTSLAHIKRFLHMNPEIVTSWEGEIKKYYTLPAEKKLIVITDGFTPRPNMIFSVGHYRAYDKFLVLRVHRLIENSYILDVDYLGPGSNESGLKLEFTL